MPKPSVRLLSDLQSLSRSARGGEGVPFRAALEAVGRSIPFAEAIVISNLPRGSLQVVQPMRVPEQMLKAYARGSHAEDRLTWTAILRRRAVSAAQAFGRDFEATAYFRNVMQPLGLRFAAAAPLASPVLPGYAGAIHLYRRDEQDDFTANELELLTDAARQVGQIIDRAREMRDACDRGPIISERPASRLLAVDRALRELGPDPALRHLDSHLREQLLDHARTRLEAVNGELIVSDRLQIPDARGDLWTFRAVTYNRYPALTSGPVVIFCIQPDCCEWSRLRPTDFGADPELARLIPAMRFMEQEYRRGPTLAQIAGMVQLSPFHFHRRFTELLGLTPKHFMVECQIYDAKRRLMEKGRSLAQIAKDCGFAHQSHFTSRFKQTTGMTPTRWRRVALQAPQQR